MRRVPQALTLVLRLLLGVLLLYAAWTKLADPRSFVDAVANYRILPARLVPWLAAALPGIEIALGAALLLGLWLRAAAWSAALLLAVFTIAVATALLRGIDLACGCFGGSNQFATWTTVARNAILMAAALVVGRSSPRRGSPEKS